MFLTSLKQTCNEYLIKFSENQSVPKLENRKTSPCSPCASNLLHVPVSRILGYYNLCSPGAPGELIVPEKYRFVLSTCITDFDVVEMGSCDVVGVKTPCMGDCRPASRRVMSDTSPTYR